MAKKPKRHHKLFVRLDLPDHVQLAHNPAVVEVVADEDALRDVAMRKFFELNGLQASNSPLEVRPATDEDCQAYADLAEVMKAERERFGRVLTPKERNAMAPAVAEEELSDDEPKAPSGPTDPILSEGQPLV